MVNKITKQRANEMGTVAAKLAMLGDSIQDHAYPLTLLGGAVLPDYGLVSSNGTEIPPRDELIENIMEFVTELIAAPDDFKKDTTDDMERDGEELDDDHPIALCRVWLWQLKDCMETWPGAVREGVASEADAKLLELKEDAEDDDGVAIAG